MSGSYRAMNRHTGHNKKRKRAGRLKKNHTMHKNQGNHLSECYIIMYPQDKNTHCTCGDWFPDAF